MLQIVTLKDYVSAQGKRAAFWKHLQALDNCEELLKNAQKTVSKTMEILSFVGYNKHLFITSGYRTPEYNKSIGGSVSSLHCFCLAIDLWDPDMIIGKSIAANLQAMEQVGVWMESLDVTHSPEAPPEKHWCHLQVVPPKSGNRIFLPR